LCTVIDLKVIKRGSSALPHTSPPNGLTAEYLTYSSPVDRSS
jgi:hypothetical protein